jgi:uncharacterized protein (TIGR03067 family)
MRMEILLVLAASLVTVADRPPKPKKVDPVQEEMKRLQGKWSIVSLESNGRQFPAERLQGLNYKLEIKETRFIREIRGRTHQMTMRIDSTKSPKVMDLTNSTVPPRTDKAIYKLEGDKLTICQSTINGQRPADFTSQGKVRAVLMVWKRDK